MSKCIKWVKYASDDCCAIFTKGFFPCTLTVKDETFSSQSSLNIGQPTITYLPGHLPCHLNPSFSLAPFILKSCFSPRFSPLASSFIIDPTSVSFFFLPSGHLRTPRVVLLLLLPTSTPGPVYNNAHIHRVQRC